MPRFSANLGFLFPELPFLERFDAAARAGFAAVEYASPYEYPAPELRGRLNDAGLSQVLINSPAGNLAWAGEKGLAAGVKLVIEPLNPRDAPGYLLRTQEQGAAIAAAIGRDRLGLQFDIYHCQTAQGDVTTRLEALMPVIDHMQLADVPGRHEPGTGEIGWGFVFRRIDELGYAGWIGCEYTPLGDTVEGLAWRQRYGV